MSKFQWKTRKMENNILGTGVYLLGRTKFSKRIFEKQRPEYKTVRERLSNKGVISFIINISVR